MRHLNNGTDHRHSKSRCDQSSPARRTMNCADPTRMRESWDVIKIHYSDVIMSTIASQITSLTIVYSTVYSGADLRKYQGSASLAFLVTSEFPAQRASNTKKKFPFDDVIMLMGLVNTDISGYEGQLIWKGKFEMWSGDLQHKPAEMIMDRSLPETTTGIPLIEKRIVVKVCGSIIYFEVNIKKRQYSYDNSEPFVCHQPKLQRNIFCISGPFWPVTGEFPSQMDQ